MSSPSNSLLFNKFGQKPDWQLGDIAVEHKKSTHSARNVRAGLLSLAYWLTQAPKHRGLLLLEKSRMTNGRLKEELGQASKVLNQSIAQRIGIGVVDEAYEHIEPFNIELTESEKSQLLRWVSAQRKQKNLSEGSPAVRVLKLLLNRWLLQEGAMTVDALQNESGFSYPTVSKALQQLGDSIDRKTDRSVGLLWFPRNEWSRLLASNDLTKNKIGYEDRSGSPRSPDYLIKLLSECGDKRIAISGSHGAAHHNPLIDIYGTPRLDICVNNISQYELDKIITSVDPALKRADSFKEFPRLIVWPLERKEPRYEKGYDGTVWADPVQCLIALHDMRFDPIAEEFLRSYPPAKTKAQ